jgi:putative N6-adenine-specific DNA methylase
MLSLFAVTSPGLEPYTTLELHNLGCLPIEASQSLPSSFTGGVEFTGDINAVYRANLYLRTASRILLRLGEFHASAFTELKRHTQSLPWNNYINPGQAVAVRVTCRKSRLYHSSAVAREIITAIVAAIGKPVVHCKFDESQSGAIPQLVIVRLLNDRCTISIDTSGQLLHRRGYRLATAKAPLRETLAAGILLASNWDSCSSLLDPFCGSGTIAIEAALLACQIPPGISRSFSFMDWPIFQNELWSAIISTQQRLPLGDSQTSSANNIIIASDRDAGAIRIAKSNAERAGVAQYIEFSQRSVSAIDPVSEGWIVTNPPYGIRVRENKDLRNLYAQFGNVLRNKCPGWQVTVMCSDLSLLHQLKIPLDTSLSLINGGIPVRVGRGVVQSRVK